MTYLYLVLSSKFFRMLINSGSVVGDSHWNSEVLALELQEVNPVQFPEQDFPVFSQSFRSSISSIRGSELAIAKLLNASKIGR